MSSQSLPKPSLFKILAAIFYDLIVVCGILMITGFIIIPIYHGLTHEDSVPAGNWLFRIILYLVVFGYYAFSWLRGGQTIGMKSWKLRLVSDTHKPMTLPKLFIRFVGGQLSFSIALIGYLMLLIGPRHRMLHDLISGSHIVSLQTK
ncbi:RDD family protein [Gynuella sunshinyii]|nr:RDD family protein [Gynuella sunshinyii]